MRIQNHKSWDGSKSIRIWIGRFYCQFEYKKNKK